MTALRPAAPEGVEFDTKIYLESDDGLQVCVALKGAAAFPTENTISHTIKAAMDSVSGFSDAPWRAMKRDEIPEYKRKHEDTSSSDDEEEDF